MFERTESGSVLPSANSLQIRLVSSFNRTLAPMPGLELEVPPGSNFSFDVFEQCNAHDARSRKHEHADEHPGNVESLASDRNQITQPLARTGKLADKTGNKTAADSEPQACIGRSDACGRIDEDRKNDEKKDYCHRGSRSNTERQDENRGEGNERGSVERVDDRVDMLANGVADRNKATDRNTDSRSNRKA